MMPGEATVLARAEQLYRLENCAIARVPAHDGGRNTVFIVTSADGGKRVLRVSALDDRTENDYLAETDFVRYLAQNGAPVADVIPSCNSRLVERIAQDGHAVFLSMFGYAEGMLLSDNGYRYREGAPLEEYFFGTGKTLGAIHRLSRQYVPRYPCRDFRKVFSRAYIDRLIPDDYAGLKAAVFERLRQFEGLPADPEVFGMVHFDFSDGNYHIDMDTGRITVFDFDNCMNCWYMFDLANLWTHGEGWCMGESDPEKRRAIMNDYFSNVLDGYKEETDLSEEMLKELPLFIDMVLIENIVDEFECCRRAGEEVDYEDIEDAAECLVNNIPFAGIIEA